MAWLMQWWTFVATVLVVFVPGLVAAWSIGLRRLGAWAFAPVASVAMISLLATVYGFARIPWTLLSAVVGLAVMAALLVGCRFLLRIPLVRPRAVGSPWLVIIALAGAAVLIAVRVGVYIGDPGNISQTSDAPFHLGAVRAIIERATASPFGLGGLIDPDVPGAFYPGAWHATDSLVSLLGGSIAVATNMLTIVVATIVWPLGIAWLTQVVTGRRLAAAAAAAMSSMLVIFPLEMMQYGALYAYFLAVALLPAAIAVLVILTGRRWAPAAPFARRIVAPLVAAALAGAALSLAQPSVLLAWGLALWLYAAEGVVEQWRRRSAYRAWGTAGLAAALVLLAFAWWRMRHLVTADVWSAVRSGRDALIEILSSGFAKAPPAWWISVLLVVGLVAVLRRAGTRWLAFGWAAFAFLAFVAYAVRSPSLRVLLVGPWYSDPYRLMALVPVMLIPVAAAGVVLLVDLVSARLLRRRESGLAGGPGPEVVRTPVSAVAVGVLLAIGVAVVAAQPLVLRYKLLTSEYETQSTFPVNERAWLSVDERALLSRLGDEVPAGARVLGNPTTGAALGYFMSGVDIYPAKWKPSTRADYSLLGEHLQDATTDPAVCAAVHTLGAEYVLDFGIGDDNAPGVVREMPGFTDLEDVPGFELVDRQGEAKLWRITACP